MSEYFGKYRGKVVNNVDPLQLGRLQVSVPGVLGVGRMSWANPCLPYAGPGVGLFAIPPVGANVWVEFEAGKSESPIWSGCFWGTKLEVPLEAQTPTAAATLKLLKTPTTVIQLDDTPGVGGITLAVGPSAAPIASLALDTTGNVELSTATGTVALTPDGTQITYGLTPAEQMTIQLSAAGISIENTAMSIQVSLKSVSINQGALEVV